MDFNSDLELVTLTDFMWTISNQSDTDYFKDKKEKIFLIKFKIATLFSL